MPMTKYGVNGKENWYVDEFAINTKPVSITVECPNCGNKIEEDINVFDWEELWYNGEHVECPECGCVFRLEGACCDVDC